MSKIVFITGAGFSAPAGIPVQADIMSDVVRAKSQPIQDNVRSAYTTLFNIVDPDDMRNVPLEDVFTMLDRAHRNNELIPGLDHSQIRESLVSLIEAIVHEFNKKFRDADLSKYQPFFQKLIDKRKDDGSELARKDDPFCIVSLNWDTIPECLINNIGDKEIGIDYGCYDYALDESVHHVPSILQKAQGLFNVKLLKPHGSLNWAYCPSCNRLFSSTGSGSMPEVCFPRSHKCRFCKSVELSSLIITPTLVKELGQTHLKTIWHNLQMDLQEAERIVFLGYSFPMADFEFRYTLLKAILTNDNPKVRVILYPPDYLIKDQQEKWIRSQTEDRYLNFFGQRDIDIKYMDVLEFMSNDDLIWNW